MALKPKNEASVKRKKKLPPLSCFMSGSSHVLPPCGEVFSPPTEPPAWMRTGLQHSPPTLKQPSPLRAAPFQPFGLAPLTRRSPSFKGFSSGVYLSGRAEAKAALLPPTRSAEVWPLSVPALSQLSHRACSPDCTVTHWVVSLWSLMHCAWLHHRRYRSGGL